MTQISGQNWKCWHSTDWKETNNKTWMCSDWREVNCVRTGSLDEDVSSSQFLSERMSLTTRTRTCGRGVVCCPLVRSSSTFCPAALGLGGVEWAWPVKPLPLHGRCSVWLAVTMFCQLRRVLIGRNSLDTSLCKIWTRSHSWNFNT